MKKRKDLYRKVRNCRVEEKIVTVQMSLAHAHEVRLRLMYKSMALKLKRIEVGVIKENV